MVPHLVTFCSAVGSVLLLTVAIGEAALGRADSGNADALKVIREGADGYAQELAPVIANTGAT